MSRSRCRLTTNLTLLLAGFSQTGCPGGGGESCGPGDAPATGLVAAGDQVTLTYGNFSAGLNNDCPESDAPEGIISMTIQGTQTDGTGILTFCVPRPDRLAKEDLAFDLDVAGSEIHVIDVEGSTSTCTLSFDRTRPPTGIANTDGLCDNGAGTAGFAFTANGAVSLDRTCGANLDKVSVSLTGTVAITQ